MICNSCRRGVDPTRSFCTNCGSAVFVDEGPLASRAGRAVLRLAEAARERAEAAQSPTRTAPPARQLARQPARRQARRAPAAAASAAGCVAGLVRLAIFVSVLWYGGGWLLSIPEVRTLKDAVAAGAFTDDQVTAAGSAIRARVLQALGRE